MTQILSLILPHSADKLGVKWKEELRIHLEDASIQHRRLSGLIDTLLTAIEDSRPPRAIRSAFADLCNYMELHFSDEEEFMKRHRYPVPLLESHARVHADMLDRVRRIQAEFESGEPIDLSMPARLRGWLDEEEGEHDKRYLDYFRARAGI